MSVDHHHHQWYANLLPGGRSLSVWLGDSQEAYLYHLNAAKRLKERRVVRLCRSAYPVLLLFPFELQAQITFNLTSIARLGDRAPVPRELVHVSSPSLNDSGQVAFVGDGAVLLRANDTRL